MWTNVFQNAILQNLDRLVIHIQMFIDSFSQTKKRLNFLKPFCKNEVNLPNPKNINGV